MTPRLGIESGQGTAPLAAAFMRPLVRVMDMTWQETGSVTALGCREIDHLAAMMVRVRAWTFHDRSGSVVDKCLDESLSGAVAFLPPLMRRGSRQGCRLRSGVGG